MDSIVQYIDLIHTKKISIPIYTRPFYYLKPYYNNKILIIGTDSHPKYDTLSTFKMSEIVNRLNHYDLFVLDKSICNQSRGTIHKILNIFKINNKNVIVSCYTTYLNFNIDNNKGMFRPIDITKYPFNINKNITVLKYILSKKYTISYIILLLTFIYTNYAYSHKLYKVVLVLLIICSLIFPVKKIIFIKNTEII